MARKLLALSCVLAVSVVVAACGSDSSSSSSSTSTPAAAATTAAPASTTSGSTGSVDASDPAVKQAVAACKQSVDSNPAVKADIKGDLEGICDKAASGDPAAVKQATKEVCLKIVADSVPAAAADQAKAACNAAG